MKAPLADGGSDGDGAEAQLALTERQSEAEQLTSQDNVGHVVPPVPSHAATVVLALVVEELLVLQVQTRLAVREQLVPVGHAPLLVHQELRGKQGSRVRAGVSRGHIRGEGGHGVRSGVTVSNQGAHKVGTGGHTPQEEAMTSTLTCCEGFPPSCRLR